MNSSTVPGNHTANIELLNRALSGKHNATVSLLRLDKIHPVVSGNKIFKLHYFLEEALHSVHKQVVTFGGAYSNHLAATAFACKMNGLRSVGIVRGEEPEPLSHTLLFCLENGMELEFISRSSYKKIDDTEFLSSLLNKYGGHTLVPEGGFSQRGVEGAKLIAGYFNPGKFTHICCAVGTATTFAGLIMGSECEAELTGFSVLKNMDDIDSRLKILNVGFEKKYYWNGSYHFGGYAKKTTELINFMNNFYNHTKIPLDFVYTGKMMFGVYDLINKNYFPGGSDILCIHTGGLQGNRSLSPGTLIF
ncbi:MAG: pyridoxal-phosphate dependent enzyme [Ginsengibacter sp.]